MCEGIAITNYSSFFINGTYFDNADLIIMDDAHSSENYIASNWTLKIERGENKHEELYFNLLENIKNLIPVSQYNRMLNSAPSTEELQWFDKVPNIKLLDVHSDIYQIIDTYVADTKLQYPWENIKDNLIACNMFISWSHILIRPYIPPTLTLPHFINAKQRIYMSATLGLSGELERITGIPHIHRLKMVRDWNKKAIGRRFFIFPHVSFTSDRTEEFILKLNALAKRSLILVQADKTANHIIEFLNSNGVTVFSSKYVESSKEAFIKSDNAVTVLANRFDGIDLLEDECRMLIISSLPNATHLQEKFLITRMAASILFNERIKTRIIQALGRCTRSNVDYAAVCIFGEDLMNELISPKKLMHYHPELQAEIEFGYKQATDQNDIDKYLTLLNTFLVHGEDWQQVEDHLLGLREQKAKELEATLKQDNIIFEKLLEASRYEVHYTYNIWKEDYETSLDCIEKIIGCLNAPVLKGYYGYWNYIAGYVSYLIYKSGKLNYLQVSKSYMKAASSSTISITWFNKLIFDEYATPDNENYF